LPWYTGPDDNTFPLYFDLMMYFGALRERSLVRNAVDAETWEILKGQLPSLGEGSDEFCDPTEEDWERLGALEIMICNYSRTSLVGLAREKIVETAQQWEADYLFWWDDDMRLEKSAFLRLFRHQKPVISALAFTARHPIHPVIYRLTEKWDVQNQAKVVERSDIVFDYPRDQLIGSEDIGGDLAVGAAVMLFDMDVFKQIPKPWFTSTGCGEDFFFCYRCQEHRVPRYVDTSVKTFHLEHAARWCDESSYWYAREHHRDLYQDAFKHEVINEVVGGKVITITPNGERRET
jgi:hypothetical protein